MAIINLEDISLAYGHVALLDKVDLSIEAGERVCLIGRNGEGKSTLMKVINGDVLPDEGVVRGRSSIRIAMLQQEVPEEEDLTVYEVVAAGLHEVGKLIADYHHTVHELETNQDEAVLYRLGQLQQSLDSCDGWRLEQRVTSVISKLELPMDSPMAELSGGYKRRVLLARALVNEPDLLLLDEPTNHLDIEGIQWIEDFLKNFNGALLFITHDRAFLQNLATRIIELDRGKLTSWPGSYELYKERKQQQLEVEADQNAKFDKVLAQEEKWIRQGIKARRTRNEGRVRALQSLRKEHSKRRDQQSKAKLSLDSKELSGKLVVEVDDVSYRYDKENLVSHFSTRIMRGERIGIMGPNGSGKSTLIKLLLGELAPDSGEVKLGTKLQVAYFDQQRAQLDPEKSVIDNLDQGSQQITVNGKTKHVVGYLQDFLFPPQRAMSPVKSLSGGERNRLLLARLFCRPANLLVMDEPTNDLDVETLELLEELLLDFKGTMLIVSHDRAFLDNVVTSTLVFEGEGKLGEYVGGYKDWLRQSHSALNNDSFVASEKKLSNLGKEQVSKSPAAEQDKKLAQRRKLNNKEQRELDRLPKTIEKLEFEKSELETAIGQSEFYQQEKDVITQSLQRLEDVNKQLEESYQRWEELESLA